MTCERLITLNLACSAMIVQTHDSTPTCFVQTDIVVLNCDVCCSFPLTAMLGKFADFNSTRDHDFIWCIAR